MQENFENPELPETRSKTSPFTLGLGALVAAAIAVSLWFLFQPLQSRKSSAPQGTIVIRMNSGEAEYANRIKIDKVELSRAENFLHQEVTTTAGELYNSGGEPVLGLALTAEFSDDLNQVVLRESRAVLGTSAAALAPGERRAFEISFDHIPASWNRQTPVVRVSQLRLAGSKSF